MITNFKIFEKKDRGKEVIYTFKTKAKSFSRDRTSFKEYDVNILLPKIEDRSSSWNQGYRLILSIEGTPGSWYVKTLLEGTTRYLNSISIQGNDWFCDNWNEVMKELLEKLPELEWTADHYEEINKFNV